MHEFSVTSWIVDALLDLAKKQHSKKILEVHLKIGKMRALSIDQVKFCYDILAKGTALEGSELISEEVKGEVRCSNCEYHGEFNPEGDAYHFGIPPLVCPICGHSLVVEGGDECVIAKVRMLLPSTARNDSA
jgi:hydrogenase nickel incorporation protein HypA/HybF